MRRTARILSAAVALLMPLLSSAADVTLVNIDGTGVVSDLANVARLELTDGGASYRLVSLVDGSAIVSGSLSELRRLSFVDEELKGSEITAAFEVSADGIASRSGSGEVRIYGLGGALVKVGADGVVSTDGLRPGVYIVVSGGKAAKVVVK